MGGVDFMSCDKHIVGVDPNLRLAQHEFSGKARREGCYCGICPKLRLQRDG